MGKVKIPYYTVKRGRGFWQPKKEMRDAGFKSVSCGPDGPAAWARAQAANEAWQAYRRGEVPKPKNIYPPGSIGEAWERYRRTHEWRAKSPATRKEWDQRAWKWIGAVFADVDPRTITMEQMSDLRQHIHGRISNREAHRVIKVWRAFWKVMAAMGYCSREADPSLGIRNTAEKGASGTWKAMEVWQQIRAAHRMGYPGMALCISIIWDTGCSPIDARNAKASQIVTDGAQTFFAIDRAKTGKPAFVPLSRRSVWLLRAMEQSLGVAFIGEAQLVRNRSGEPYTYRSNFNKDHRAVRDACFGKDEKRTLADIRRTAASEAIDGEISTGHLSQAMGNTIGRSNQLWQVYAKPSHVAGLAFRDARRRGRKKGTEQAQK